MDIPRNELFAVLQEFNPWWNGQVIRDLPDWERSAAQQIWRWASDGQSSRSLLVTGARQIGKTTLFRQTIRRLVASNYPPTNILYATFDHPLLKLAGLQQTLRAWDDLFPVNTERPRMLFLDEIQFVPDWQTWLKLQVDFHRENRIAVTGSASPLREASTESGVGRWETLPLATLSFAEYLMLRNVTLSDIPKVQSMRELLRWQDGEFARARASGRGLTAHFHDYLLRGGFPEPAQAQELARCQRLLREDIVDKVLKRDMTALYGVRRVLDLEKLFLYLCYHDGGILDVPSIARNLENVNRQSVVNYLDLFESTHLVYRLKPFGYGKEVLRGRDKVYLADAALPGAVLLLGQRLLEMPERLGAAVETAFFKHAFTRYYANTPTFSYWQDRKHRGTEVDLIAQMGNRIVPFEVKYRDAPIKPNDIRGLRRLLHEREIDLGYVITQRWEDFREIKNDGTGRILAVPAPLACYWMSSVE